MIYYIKQFQPPLLFRMRIVEKEDYECSDHMLSALEGDLSSAPYVNKWLGLLCKGLHMVKFCPLDSNLCSTFLPFKNLQTLCNFPGVSRASALSSLNLSSLGWNIIILILLGTRHTIGSSNIQATIKPENSEQRGRQQKAHKEPQSGRKILHIYYEIIVGQSSVA